MTNNEKKKGRTTTLSFNPFPFQGTEPGSSAYTAKTSRSQCWLILDEFYHLCLLLDSLNADGTGVTSLPVWQVVVVAGVGHGSNALWAG